jgi:hypothetical protein
MFRAGQRLRLNARPDNVYCKGGDVAYITRWAFGCIGNTGSSIQHAHTAGSYGPAETVALP